MAQRAGVSRSTASRALGDDPRIGFATRTSVKRAAAELQYIPNATARSLRVKRTRTFGLLLPALSDPADSQIASAFEQAAGEDGFEVLFLSGLGDPARERLAMRTFSERGMDGVAILAGMTSLSDAHELVDPNRLVVMLSERRELRGHPVQPGMIEIDEAAGVEAAVDHLVDRGYRRIAYVESGTRISNLVRREACASALRRRGFPDELDRFEAPENAWRAPEELAGRIAARLPDALVSYDDKLALALMSALRDLGIRCPDDVGIVGFDAIPFAAMSNPRLTTVAAPYVELGHLAATTLINALQTGTLPHGVLLSVELVEGGSTRPASRQKRGPRPQPDHSPPPGSSGPNVRLGHP